MTKKTNDDEHEDVLKNNERNRRGPEGVSVCNQQLTPLGVRGIKKQLRTFELFKEFRSQNRILCKEILPGNGSGGLETEFLVFKNI